MENTESMQPKSVRTQQEALDELIREMNVRKRCFTRWIADGRVSATDAQDRLDRIATAVTMLHAMSSEDAKAAVSP